MAQVSVIPVLQRTGIFAPLLIASLLLLGAVAVLASPRLQTPPPRAFVPPPVSPLIEERYGVRVSQLSVTADGGMLDFRYLVLDPNKAIELADNPSQVLNGTSAPLVRLIAEDDGTQLQATLPMPHKDALIVGRSYFVLFGNNHGAVKSGRPVTIVIGDLRLEHVVAS